MVSVPIRQFLVEYRAYNPAFHNSRKHDLNASNSCEEYQLLGFDSVMLPRL
jgi:hypothetical protein